jgi:methylated-DNA-protein-cysteine methyltransferase-like protein
MATTNRRRIPAHRDPSRAREPRARAVSAALPSAHPAYVAIYRVVRAIPRGRVATYGQVAMLAGLPGRARQAGYALHALPEASRVPWQRVVNSRGTVSPRGEPGAEDRQRALLEAEGVEFGADGRIDLRRYRWLPRA